MKPYITLLTLTLFFSIGIINSSKAQFVLDSLVQNNTLKTYFEYNEKGLPNYIEDQEFLKYTIEYNEHDNIEKVTRSKFTTNEIVQIDEVIRYADQKIDSINLYDKNSLHTSIIFHYEDDILIKTESHHFYNDTINTEEHVIYEYSDGQLTSVSVKYGEILVGQDSYSYDDNGLLTIVHSSYSGYFSLEYDDKNQLNSFLNDNKSFTIKRNNAVTSKMYLNPIKFYEYYNIFNGFGLGIICLEEVFRGDQPIGVKSDDEKFHVEYFYSTTVNNTETNLHGQWLEVFPNPSSDLIYFNQDLDIELLRIYGIDGKLITELKSVDQYVSISSFHNGTYLIEAFTKDNKRFVSQFIKN